MAGIGALHPNEGKFRGETSGLRDGSGCQRAQEEAHRDED